VAKWQSGEMASQKRLNFAEPAIEVKLSIKLGSIDKALPHAGFYPDSQNIHSDAAKIDIISESCKYISDYFKFFEKNQPYSITFL
jgi:hypothetical protein